MQRRLTQFLLRRNTLPAAFEIVALYVEFALYMSAVTGADLQSSFISINDTTQTSLILLLVVVFVIRMITGATLIRFFYISVLVVLNQLPFSSLSAINYALLVLTLFIDVLSKIQFSFQSRYVTAEDGGIIKLLHYLSIVSNIVLVPIILPRPLINIACLICYLLLALFKHTIMCSNLTYKNLLIRAYLLCACIHLSNIIISFLSIAPILGGTFSLILSQAGYTLYLHNRTITSIDQLHSQEKYVQLVFEIMRYMHCEEYDQRLQKQIMAFLPPQELGQRHTIIQLRSDSALQALLYRKLLKLISKQQTVKQLLLQGEMYLLHGRQLQRCYLAVQQADVKHSRIELFTKLKIYRLKQTMLQCFEQGKRQIRFANYSSYLANEQFRKMLVKATAAQTSLWEYSRQTEINGDRMLQLLQRVITFEKKLSCSYDQLAKKCLSISLLYCSYLLDVAKDIVLAKKILNDLAFNEEFEVNLDVTNKLFLRLDLTSQPLLRVAQVGCNVTNLLGFSRKQLQGQSLQSLLPQFYRQEHNSQTTRYLSQHSQSLFLFAKQTLIKNKGNYYQKCAILLQLDYDLLDGLFMSGYLHIPPRHEFLWNNYVFIRQDGSIAEYSDHLREMLPPNSKIHKISDLFDATGPLKPDRVLTKTLEQGAMQYYPLHTLHSGDTTVTYFVCKDYSGFANQLPALPNARELVNNIKASHMLSQFYSYTPSQYGRTHAKIRKQIKSCKYWWVKVAILLSLAIALCLQGYALSCIYAQRSSNQHAVDVSANLVGYYSSSIKLGIDISYLDLLAQYGYKLPWYHTNIITNSLQLQSVNQKLKQYSIGNYSYTVPSGAKLNANNYELMLSLAGDAYTVEQLAGNSFAKNMYMDRIRLYLPTIFVNSIDDYDNGYSKSLALEQSQVKGIGFILIGVETALFLLIIIAFIKLQQSIRQNEHSVLGLISLVTYQQRLIDDNHRFMLQITQQDMVHAHQPSPQYRTNPLDVSSRTADFSRSEMSFRDVGRNLLEDSFNKSNLLIDVINKNNRDALNRSALPSDTNREDLAAMGGVPFEVRPRDCNKTIILVPICLLSLIITLALFNEVTNGYLKSFNSHSSVANLMVLLHTSTAYSECVIALTNSLNSGDFTHLATALDTYKTTSTKSADFPESSFAQFADFQGNLTRIRYQYLCTYIDCLSQYASQINIIYTTTTQKMILYIANIATAASGLSKSAIGTLIVGSYKASLDLVLYAEQAIRQMIGGIVVTYMNNFSAYSAANSHTQTTEFAIVIALTAVSLLTAMLFIGLYLRPKEQYLLRMCRIVKIDANTVVDEDFPISNVDTAKAKAIKLPLPGQTSRLNMLNESAMISETNRSSRMGM